jgi:hypothetical protein
MTAPDRAAWTAAVRQMCDAIDADPSVPIPVWGRQFCPAVFRADDSPEPAGALAIAESLGVTEAEVKECAEEDGGWPYLEVTGKAGVLHVRITALAEPVLLDPLGEPQVAWSLAGGLVVNR